MKWWFPGLRTLTRRVAELERRVSALTPAGVSAAPQGERVHGDTRAAETAADLRELRDLWAWIGVDVVRAFDEHGPRSADWKRSFVRFSHLLSKGR